MVVGTCNAASGAMRLFHAGLGYSQGEDVSAQAIILEPVREGGIDVLLLFFPGALTPPQAYFPLINIIQKKSAFRLWATILDPGKGSISPPMIEASFDGMIKRAKDLGFEPGELSIDRIFVAGHRTLPKLFGCQSLKSSKDFPCPLLRPFFCCLGNIIKQKFGNKPHDASRNLQQETLPS